MFCASSISDKVPYFNAPIYLQNKSVIGKVDEILGPINEVYFSVKMNEGMVASSFQRGDKVYIGNDKLLPIERFLPKPKSTGTRVASVSIAFVLIALLVHRTKQGNYEVEAAGEGSPAQGDLVLPVEGLAEEILVVVEGGAHVVPVGALAPRECT
ncbi:hypothetical protein ID866_6832 [Astraeus odoratus]|nr:hypothetical protein ID866_6832 [Astraeus odoratus]